MDMIADSLLLAASCGAAFYCLVLSRRLRRFTKLENGMGGAIAALSTQVDEMTRTMGAAQTQALQSERRLSVLTKRGEEVSAQLELLVASLHDISPPPAEPRKPTLSPSYNTAPAPAARGPLFKSPMPKPHAPLSNAAAQSPAAMQARAAARDEGFSPPPRLGEANTAPVARRFLRRRLSGQVPEVTG